MAEHFRLLREALHQLSVEPDAQRCVLDGTVVTDELVLDLDNALVSLPHASMTAGVELDTEVVSELRRLKDALSVPPGDPLWDDEALDRHPTWAEARLVARRLLPRLPDD